uniref:Multidrug resistance-associated protein 5-like n=1 Tax=Timema bartmani TaxID=61472 RepID=A0A7R9EWB2_9NEOP|nr:unnamed protein product [Timema bartmani]
MASSRGGVVRATGEEDGEVDPFDEVALDTNLQEPLEDNFRDLDISLTGPKSPYRPYMRTTPQYIPGRGMARYLPALKNLIPVRRKPRTKNMIAVDSAGFLSFISFSWLSGYMYSAYKKGLTLNDVPQGSPLDSSDLNAQRLELLWQKEITEKGRKEASFGRVVWKFVRTRVLFSCLVFCVSQALGFISPTLFMRELLQYTENEDSSTQDGVKWALLLTLSEFLRAIFFSWNWALNYRTAVRLRSACLAMLYRKVIRLHSLGDKSIGELINIFANDSQRIFDVVLFGPMIVGGPVMTVCGIGYILWLLGPWALLGMIVFLLFYPTQYGISRLTGYLRGKTVVVSDERVRLMTDILNSIKLIKMYTWEKYFSKNLFDIRTRERNLLQKTAYCQSLSISMAPTVPVISAIVTFLAHISAGNNLTAAQAFPLISVLGNQLKDALSRIREATKALIDSSIAFTRIKGLLLLDEGNLSVIRPIDKQQAVCISKGTFAWDAGSSVKNRALPLPGSQATKEELEKLNPISNGELQYTNIISDIDFQARKGHLVGVCGQVGSGKTSLLLAALGQIRLVTGQVTRDGTCAYVSQEPWVLNATLRENILFGENFDAKRYYDTLYCCSLTEDINMLPGGDQTEIGEKGINLSGGQKQRVALARALYADRDVYFLDDPLSAVDTHVGAHIFDKYIRAALKEKTVIFVTHHLEYLSHCDEVYFMKEGRIAEQGTHQQLMDQKQDYSLMMTTRLTEIQLGDSARVAETVSVQRRSSIGKNSTSSKGSVEEMVEKMNPAGEKLTTAEQVERGQIRCQTYKTYIAAAGGYIVSFLVVLTFLLNVGSTAFSSWWLAEWIKAGGGNTTLVNELNETVLSNNINDNPDFSMYQLVYSVMIAVILGTIVLSQTTEDGEIKVRISVTLRASNKLHNQLFTKIINSPIKFFETTPTGRIQNLFSRDIDEVDTRLPITLESILQNMWLVLFAVMFICLVFPWFIIPMLLLFILYYFISKIFSVAIRDLKRLETITRSPIFSWVGTTVQGLSTIHAFGKEGDFIAKFNQMFDENTTCVYLYSIAMRWLAIRVDTLAAFLVIALHGQVSPALAGLALAYSAHISGMLQYTIRLLSETEARFISVERINAYLQSLEAEGVNSGRLIPMPDWPSKGTIKFQNVNLRYREGLPNVLKDININIRAGEKIGIIGRTGSGKSSLVTALFRLVELSAGKIKIDGEDISGISLQHLRNKLAVIPQDPVLFTGTIRSNLDPFRAYKDEEVWAVLEKTRLKDRVTSETGQLDCVVGDNLSMGERQLLCLARALLKNTKILVLDEATAAVDPETEVIVQTTIQQEFSHCTVLTIAHRLSTVTSSDRILVMDRGQVVELGTPANLSSNPDSQFSRMLTAAQNGAVIL